MTVHLLKPGKGGGVVYRGEPVVSTPEHLLLHARWERERLDLGYIVFDPEDHFFEHYWVDRWFNIFEIRTPSGRLKGWYCNVTRPARFEGDMITSEDLELDLFVPPDRENPLTLDEDEFAARSFDDDTRRAALKALETLKEMARHRTPPFDSTGAHLSLALTTRW